MTIIINKLISAGHALSRKSPEDDSSKFLLPEPKLFSLFKDPNDSYDAAIYSLALRIKEVQAMHAALKTKCLN